jgi:hypothetical protein
MSKSHLLKSRSANLIALEPEVAIAVIGLFTASADDEGITIAEEYALSEMLGAISQFEDYSDDDFQQLTDKVYSLLEEEEAQNVIDQAIASLPNQDYREAAYITALTVVAIDDEVPQAEEEYLAELQQALNISDERAEEIIDELFGEEEDCDEEEEE